MTVRRWVTALAALTVPLALVGAAPAESSTASLSQLRQDTVDRAYAFLNHPQKFKLSAGGAARSSSPNGNVNYLGVKSGSRWTNTNRNAFNGYTTEAWCGYFAAAAWTGKKLPDASSYPRIPAVYQRALDWKNASNMKFVAFDPTKFPTPGDALIWKTNAGGHVGVVVAVDKAAKKVTTIEGNVPGKAGQSDADGYGDAIRKRTYTWSRAGLHWTDHVIQGFSKRQ